MASVKRAITGIAAAALILTSYTMSVGCGDDENGNTGTAGTTGTATAAKPAATAAATTPAPGPAPAQGPEPAPAPSPAAGPPVVIDQTVDNLLAHPGDTLVFEARVEGEAARVYVSMSGYAGGLYEVELAPGATVAGVTTWSGTWTVPMAPDTESYRARTSAEAHDGTVVEFWGGGLSASVMPIEVVP